MAWLIGVLIGATFVLGMALDRIAKAIREHAERVDNLARLLGDISENTKQLDGIRHYLERRE